MQRHPHAVQGMEAGAKANYDGIEAFFHADFRKDLKKVNVPTRVIHGADDQIVPLETMAVRQPSWSRALAARTASQTRTRTG
ncbi:alpha/beta fold hydrolase [Roseateles sp. LKC17W]|uniref:Alpha/beta fold hydrolase n=1 Tax=Pelomonas margarita TaxID=3299031 RepID=A0ABW7FLW6_9BURK